MIKTSFIGLFLLLSSTTSFAAKRALVYNGPGACSDGCYQSAFAVALQAGFDPVYVGATALNAASTVAQKEALFKDAAVWIQPGGKATTAFKAMTRQLKAAVDEFVKSGGGYVGFCAGAFASTAYIGTTNTYGFNFMPGKTILYPQRYQASILPLKWNGVTRQVYWEGGPYQTAIPKGKAEIVATYPNGTVAAAKSIYGKGRVFVTGLHPEAPQNWREYYGLKDTDGMDQDLAVEMVNWVTSQK